MPGILAHKSIMLLARERIEHIREVLTRKLADDDSQITSLDHQLLAIVTEAARIFASDPRPDTDLPGVDFARPVGGDNSSYPISQFAVMGSMGPDIPAFTALLSPGQNWMFDHLHKGTPDPDRELVNAQSCDFIMEFWAQARDRISTDVTDASARRDLLDQMRAYTLGHLCHIAADVVSHPWVDEIQWRDSNNDLGKFHRQLEAELEALVAQTVLGRDSTRGQSWDSWWPRSGQVPDQFFAAFEAALQAVYGIPSNRRLGYRAFEQRLVALHPAVLEPGFIADGYRMYRHGVISIGYGYGYWSWWGWLALLFVPALALPLVVAAMPRGGRLFLADDGKRSERHWLEFLVAPMAFGLPAAIGYGAFLGSLTTRGFKGRYWLAMGGLILAGVLAVVFFATLGAERLPAGFTWTVLFALPAVLGLVQAVLAGIATDEGHYGRLSVAALGTLPLALMAAFVAHFSIFVALPDEDADSPFGSAGFWIGFALWAVGLLVLWIWAPFKLRDIGIREQPKGDIVTPGLVRLFDDATLHDDSQLAATSVPAQVYPSGRRPLIKLWWAGSGDLFVRCDRFQLVFSPAADGRDPQVVPAPIAPMTMAQFIALLSATVHQPGASNTGLLHGEILFPEGGEPPGDPDYVLPAGATFSDHGDGEDNTEAHDAAAVGFIKLGVSAEAEGYTLYHAPKAAQSVRFSSEGPVARRQGSDDSTDDETPEPPGYTFLRDPNDSHASDSLMSIAGDFGAILCMGAATHMKSLRDTREQPVEQVQQVFRNWNLDRRRVNEWRMIVAGDAVNEKGADRAGFDARMLGHQGPADTAGWRSPLLGTRETPNPVERAAFDEGEATARSLGWVGLMREWLATADDHRQDPLASAPMRAGNPGNQALNRGMAYLFDLVDPTHDAGDP